MDRHVVLPTTLCNVTWIVTHKIATKALFLQTSFEAGHYTSKRSRLVLVAIFSAYGDNEFANEFIQLSRWNIFNFPVFVLRFQKSFKQSYISFSFLSGIFVFVFLKWILQLSKQKWTFPRPFFKARGFCATALAWRSLQYVHSSLVKFRRSRCWLDER